MKTQKARAPRNRTLTLTAAEREALGPALCKLPGPADAATLLDRVLNQDLFEALAHLPPGFVDLLIADPPYNLAKNFNGRRFRRQAPGAYAEWIESWLLPLKRLLKPWEPDRQPNLVQTQIDNTLGDAVFTLPGRFDSEGISSTLADPAFDKLLAEASAATGDTRRSLWQEAFRILSVEQVNIIPLFHMVASVRVSPSVDYVPDVQAGNEIKLSAIRFR